jgi:hypothetical protein
MADSVLSGTLSLLAALGLLVGPPAAASLVLHWTERRITGGLLRLSGRRAVLVTGWLGVPIHELSPALMCVLFGHRIDKLVLFHPDPKTGTLGYVEHRWSRRSPRNVLGAFFVGIAPLLGGAAAILGLLALLLPGVLVLPDVGLPQGPGDVAGWAALARGLQGALAEAGRALFSRGHVASWRLWIFLYLALCIGSHISPSREDLRGSLVGGLAMFAAFLLAGAVAFACGGGARFAGLAWTSGLATGAVLLLVAAINVPLALLVGLAGRFRG